MKFVPPGPSFKIGDSLKGKRIFLVANGLNYPYVQNLLSGMKEAAELVGASVSAGDSAGDPTKAATLVQQAIGQGYDAIITQSVPAALIAQPLTAASKAGIPVIEMFGSDPELPSAKLKAMGVSGIVSSCFGCGGEEMAEAAFAESGEEVDAVVFSTPEIGVGKLEGEKFVSRLKELCPSCESRVVDAPLASWSTDLTSAAQSALQRDPSVNYLAPVFDAMVQFVEPAVASSGQDVKIVTYDGTQGGLEAVQKGTVAADPGSMQIWLGWAAIDQLGRIETSTPIVADSNVPNRMFSSQNIGEVDPSSDEAGWYGSFDFKSSFSKVWEVE
ncbi:MAG TPA: substrate-binding domain-containing protein [Solirubrobacterales bacterium]